LLGYLAAGFTGAVWTLPVLLALQVVGLLALRKKQWGQSKFTEEIMELE